MTDLKTYIETHKERFLEELFSLLRIPSVSSKAEHQPDMVKCAERWKELLLAAGCDTAEVHSTAGAPIVYAEKIIDKNAPTVLVYAHYDLMPVEPLELWKTPPFEPTIVDGKIYCRGANDDKGQSFMHAKAFEYLVKTNQLTCNVKFMFEGEEEVGSCSIAKWCTENKNRLVADVILVSDTAMIAEDIPSITTGLRGLGYVEVKITGPKCDLHSGLYGGAVANPINILCGMIAQLTDANNQITVKDFYNEVLPVSEEERALMAKAPFNETEYKNELEVQELYGEKGYSTIERLGIRPSLDVCGIWGGYTGEGAKTIIPSTAHAKISFRLVPNQDFEVITERFKKHFESLAPAGVKVEITSLYGGYSYVFPIETPAYKAAEQAYLKVYGKCPIPTRSGGSIPIIPEFERILGLKSILMGFGLGIDAIHSPNESFSLNRFFKGIETIAHFYQELGKNKE